MPRFEVQAANGTFYRADLPANQPDTEAKWLLWVLEAVQADPNWPATIRVYPMYEPDPQTGRPVPDWPIANHGTVYPVRNAEDVITAIGQMIRSEP